MPLKHLAIGIVIAAFIFAGGYYVLQHAQSIPLVRDINLGNGVIAKDVPNGVDVSVSTTTPAPSLDRPINIPSSISPDAAAIYKDRILKVRADLRNGVDVFNGWVTLGTLYQNIADYKGAEEAFEYVSTLSPSNVVSYNNLGTLYHYYLKNYPKAEANFLRAIKNDPTYALSYVNLFDLYRLSYKIDTSAAEDILKEGIKNAPSDEDLPVLLKEYQSSHVQ